MSEGRQHDPRRLSRLKPGRSEIQDEAPPIAPAKNNPDPAGELRRPETARAPLSSTQRLRNRTLRTQGAMPPGSPDSLRVGN
jgi:hypothetical protein